MTAKLVYGFEIAIAGMSVVMVALFFLNITVNFTGKCLRRAEDKKEKPAGAAQEIAVDQAPANEMEEVAAVVAAVMAKKGKSKYVVKGITRVYRGAFNHWALSGVSRQMGARRGFWTWRDLGSRSTTKSMR